MTIKYDDYDYVKVGHYSNVVMELRKERTCKDTEKVQLCSFMEQLIYKVALQHPEWTFVSDDPTWNSSSEFWRGYRFRVYAGTELMGLIRRDGYYEDSFKYEINSDRIAKGRMRRGGMCTKDLKKAIKAINEGFQPKTLEERKQKALSEMDSHKHTVDWRITRVMQDCLSSMLPALASYIGLNYEEMRPVLAGFGAPANALDALPKNLERCKGVWQLRVVRQNKTGTTVVLVDDRYMLIPDADFTASTVVTASQLSEDMSRKIGVLKLFNETEEVLEDIGMRMDETTFYIFP